MIDKDKILEIIRQKGPFLPRDLVKEIGGDTFLTGAILSQLVETKQLKLTSAKIGGSPLYYTSGQEDKLDRLYKYINEKDRRAYDLLKEKKIVRDIECEPLLRVALRSIKDFSKPLEVTINQNKEIFWKWHLITNQEAEEEIKKILMPNKDTKKEEEQRKQTESANEEIKRQQVIIPEKKEEKKENNTEVIKEAAIIEEKPKEHNTEKKERIKKQPKEKQEIMQEEAEENHQEKLETITGDLFYDKIKKAFLERKINILDAKIIKKNSEIEMNIEVLSGAGKIYFYSKAKDKKRTTDKDLGMLFIDAQLKKLPLLYVTTGELTKKAEQILKTEFKMITVLKI